MFREKRGFLDTIIPFCLNQPCAKLSTQKMSEMELKILEVIKGNRSLSRDKIAETLGNITSDGVKYHLSSLQKKAIGKS